ncbi:hypothetical protein [Chitinimonas sp.]|uniref:hypothetical protein n=1 Tax=Chitinimonas sp. TaxID=1934313 RepID=UPI0035B13EBC
MKNFNLAVLVISTSLVSMNALCAPVAISKFVGASAAGYLEGKGVGAKFYYPEGIAIDGSGNFYIADQYNNRIRKVTLLDGVTSTLAGDGTIGSIDGVGPAAKFHWPTGVAVDVAGNVYTAGYADNKIRKISPDGLVTTLITIVDKDNPMAGPWSLAVDVNLNIYFTVFGSNIYSHRVWKLSQSGSLTLLAGSATYGFQDGIGSSAKFFSPCGLAVDSGGNVYVADLYNHRVRKISPGGVVTTLAGTGLNGNVDGTAASASFSQPISVAVDGVGNVFVGEGYSDVATNRVRKITPSGVVSTVVGPQYIDASTGLVGTFRTPRFLAVGPDGGLYISDSFKQVIFKVDGVANFN